MTNTNNDDLGFTLDDIGIDTKIPYNCCVCDKQVYLNSSDATIELLDGGRKGFFVHCERCSMQIEEDRDDDFQNNLFENGELS